MATTGPGTSPGTATAAPARRIAFFVPWTEDVWYVVAVEAARAEATKLGMQLDAYDATNKVEVQIQQFDAAIAAKPEAIVLSSVDPGAMVPSIEKAHDAGIKVIVYDRPITKTTKLDALLLLDTRQIGEMQAKAVVDAMTAKHGAPKGTVIRAYGDPADTWAAGLNRGWDPYMATHPDITVLKATSGAWDAALSAANVQLLLAAHPEVDAISLDSDWLGTGLYTVLQQGGYGKVGQPKHLFLVGDGGMTSGLQAIRDGWMDFTVNNPVADCAATVVKIADMLASGKPLRDEWVEEGKPWSPTMITRAVPTADEPYAGPVLSMSNYIVDKTNVDDPTLWGNVAAEKP
jgi:simple sugar transport system substrate-binding protein/ribose transport system substrate-binding protein